MHEEYGIKLVSTADSHYPTPDAWKDRELYKRLGWLGKGKPEWLDMNSLRLFKKWNMNCIQRTESKCGSLY